MPASVVLKPELAWYRRLAAPPLLLPLLLLPLLLLPLLHTSV